MSSYIHYEMLLFLQSVLTGAALLLCYDFLRAVREVIPHSMTAVAAEDLIYWLCCALTVFAGIYRTNQGALRFFLFLGGALGVLVCSLTVSAFFEKICARMLGFPAVLVKKMIKGLLFLAGRCKIFVYKCVIKGRLASWLNLRRNTKKRE